MAVLTWGVSGIGLLRVAFLWRQSLLHLSLTCSSACHCLLASSVRWKTTSTPSASSESRQRNVTRDGMLFRAQALLASKQWHRNRRFGGRAGPPAISLIRFSFPLPPNRQLTDGEGAAANSLSCAVSGLALARHLETVHMTHDEPKNKRAK